MFTAVNGKPAELARPQRFVSTRAAGSMRLFGIAFPGKGRREITSPPAALVAHAEPMTAEIAPPPVNSGLEQLMLILNDELSRNKSAGIVVKTIPSEI